MPSPRFRSALQTLTLWLVAGSVAFAQTPTQPPSTSAPTQTPAQRDATRPPGTEQRQNVPEQGRPLPSSPTAPPGTERVAPQAPPGTTAPVSPRVAPPASTSGVPATDTSAPTSDQSAPTTDATAPGAANNPLGGNLPEPNFPSLQARPVPPLPSQERIGVTSGATLQLTLNEAIRRALASNNDIEVARGDVRYAESLLNVYQAVYDPVFTYTPQINNSVRPVSNTLSGSSGGSTVTTTDINNDFSVNKQFARGGGNYTYFFNNTRETTNSRFTQLNPFYSANQGIQFTQPLFRDRLIDRNRQQIRIQRKRLEQSDADFRRRTIEVIAAVQRAYWELVFSLRDEQNQLANVNLARENFRRTEASVAAGASAPLERAEVQTELSNREAALLLASQSVSFAENNLKQLMLRDPLAPEWSAALMPSDQPSFDETPVSLPDALKEARDNRPELRRLRLQEDINSIDIEYFRNQAKPRIDLQATLSTTALAGTPVIATGTINGTTTGIVNGQLPLISGDPNTVANAFLLSQINQLRAAQGLGAAVVPNVTVNTQTNQVPNNLQGGYGQTLQNLFSFKTRNIVVGATIQIPFRNRAARAQLAGAQILKEQLGASMRSQEQSVEVEVRNAAQSVETARRRVLTAREARRNAELQLAGEQRLYQVGRSTTFLLFQRENQLVNARNQQLRAETDYNKALADLQRATSTTLRANNVIVESPVAP